MVNKRFLDLARRQRNAEVPSERNIPKREIKNGFDLGGEPFILTYNEFGNELIRKSNEYFGGTRAEVPLGTIGEEVQNMYVLKRLALVTAIHRDRQLQSMGYFPISPLQSERLLEEGRLPVPSKYWEDLALMLYDVKGSNVKEAQGLYDSLREHKQDLSISESDLENRMLVVNAGLEKDESMPHGVKPIILPGFTKVFFPEILDNVGKDEMFNGYGLDSGLPILSQMGSGDRTLYIPNETENIGLRVLVRDRDLYLGAWCDGLTNSVSGGRVNFALQGALKV